MGYVKSHLLATVIVAAAVAVMAAGLAFARPASHPSVLPGPPNNDLPYSVVSYTAADARHAFAAEGIRLGPRSHSATITTLGNRGDILEVDAFGDPERVKASGLACDLRQRRQLIGSSDESTYSKQPTTAWSQCQSHRRSDHASSDSVAVRVRLSAGAGAISGR